MSLCQAKVERGILNCVEAWLKETRFITASFAFERVLSLKSLYFLEPGFRL